MTDDKLLLTLKHAAECVDKTVPAMLWYIRTGRLPSVKVANRHMIRPAALRRAFNIPDEAA